MQGELNCPHFSLCSALPGGEDAGRNARHHCPTATISRAFHSPLQRRASKSKGHESGCPTADFEKRGKPGSVVGSKRQRRRESEPHSPNKDQSQQIPRIRRGDTRARRNQATWDSSLPAKEEGMEKDKSPCEWPAKRVEGDPKWSRDKGKKGQDCHCPRSHQGRQRGAETKAERRIRKGALWPWAGDRAVGVRALHPSRVRWLRQGILGPASCV